ncbi:DNA primase [Nicoliella lavandulae]|uniref:DNA primase n=1 Tax=Nicoliella lavandulae TaxID=3082954 RepID=A0ABU8SL98_9LACO
MAKIPESVIDEVRQSVNITDVVSQYVQLKKQGKNLFGVCPFHEERTGSFSVSEDKQIFHCFSCGRGGNVFKFLMEIKNISFPAAVIEVAKMQNIKLPNQYLQTSQSGNRQDDTDRALINIHDEVARLYHHILVNTKMGEPALRYLHQRGLTDDVINEFQLGFAPQANLVQSFLKEKQTPNDLLVKSGLFNENDRGELTDRFFNRVMYPIRNQSGQTIAFSGRVLDKTASQAKYLNSPETKIFSKRDVVFNLDKARIAAGVTKDLILFEGFMDVIAAFQAGVKNGIASMGTSFTSQQIRQIERATKHLLICYDGDEPGQKAINRAVDTLSDSRLKLGVIQMPSGVDPDEYRRQNGDEQFQKMIQTARETPITFKLRFLKLHRNLNREDERVAYLNDALNVIATIESPVGRDVYVNQLVDQFDVDKQSLLTQLNDLANKYQRQNQNSHGYHQHKVIDQDQMPMMPTQTKQTKYSKTENAERYLLARMLHDHDIWLKVTSIDHFAFIHDRYQMLYMLAEGYFAHHDQYDAADFISSINETSLQQLVVDLEELPISEQSFQGEIDDYVNIIMNEAPLADQLNQKRADLSEAVRTGDVSQQRKIAMDIIMLEQKRQANLKNQA